MSVHEQPVVREFSMAVKEALGENVKKIILYGSQARGDCTSESDYDFIIVVERNSKDVRDKVLDVEVRILDMHGEVVASLIYDDDEWQRECRYPLGINVQMEGVLV